jgi:hypothetical protein
MSNWVVTVLVLNAAVVVAIIVLALHIAGRNVLVALEVKVALSPTQNAISIVAADGRASLPLWSPTQMTRSEWHALLDAFGVARRAYMREMTTWRNEQPREAGALARATHELEIAKRRLTRFELDVSVGRNDGPRQRVTYVRRLTPN